jgi:hypothetical protein
VVVFADIPIRRAAGVWGDDAETAVIVIDFLASVKAAG